MNACAHNATFEYAIFHTVGNLRGLSVNFQTHHVSCPLLLVTKVYKPHKWLYNYDIIVEKVHGEWLPIGAAHGSGLVGWGPTIAKREVGDTYC